jgi:hypothetical protein
VEADRCEPQDRSGITCRARCRLRCTFETTLRLHAVIDTLSVVWIALLVAVVVLFQSALKQLSPTQREGFLKERLFSGPYLWILLVLFAGMSFFEDFRIAVTLAGLAIACAAYEHWKNHTSLQRLDAPADFKSRISLIAWLVDAVVVVIALDLVLPYLHKA